MRRGTRSAGGDRTAVQDVAPSSDDPFIGLTIADPLRA